MGRYSIAPEEHFATVSFIAEVRFLGRIIPWAPNASAERMMAPRFCGS